MSSLLTCSGVDFAYGPRTVLQAIDLAIAPGEWVGLIGPNGAGKSTLLRLLVGYLAPTRGRVTLEGQPIASLSAEALARRLAVVPQAAPLAFAFRVADIVAMGRHPHRAPLQWSLTGEDRDRVRWALEITGTLPLASRRFNHLSGGEQQLVLIARALAQSTEVLLLDEPTASLDLRHQAQIVEVLQHLHRTRGTTILWIAHDLNLISRVAKRLVLLEHGRIAADGAPATILDADLLTRVYQTRVTVEAMPDGRRRVELHFADEGSLTASSARDESVREP